MLIDYSLAFGAAGVGLDQRPFDGRRRQPLVPQRNRQSGELRQIARKGPRRLRARPFTAVHIDRQAEQESRGFTLTGKLQNACGVQLKPRPRDGLDRSGDAAIRIAGRDADGLGAEIQAEQRAALRQQRCGFHERRNRHLLGFSSLRLGGLFRNCGRAYLVASPVAAVTQFLATPKSGAT